jgi:hypothetical protein
MKTSHVEQTCSVCGKQFEVREKELQWRAPKYCSPECYDKSRQGQKRQSYIPIEDRACVTCGEMFHPHSKKQRFCSRPCLYTSMRRELSANWKGGRHVRTDGYMEVYVPDHPKADNRGYLKEHRYVMEQKIGRSLAPNESVHHINGDKADNRIENLQLRIGRHGKHQAYCCADCGSRNIVPCPLD